MIARPGGSGGTGGALPIGVDERIGANGAGGGCRRIAEPSDKDGANRPGGVGQKRATEVGEAMVSSAAEVAPAAAKAAAEVDAAALAATEVKAEAVAKAVVDAAVVLAPEGSSATLVATLQGGG